MQLKIEMHGIPIKFEVQQNYNSFGKFQIQLDKISYLSSPELLSTPFTFVWFLPSVSSSMIVPIRFDAKATAAQIACMRFLSCVDERVCVHGTCLRKATATHRALIWFNASVDLHVF